METTSSLATSLRKHASFRQTDGQSPHFASRSPVFNQPVGAEATDSVEALAGFQIALGNRYNLADRPANRSDRRILLKDRATDRRRDLNVRQMEWRVEDIERTVAELVVGQAESF